jgi:hypothetical protein
VLFDDFHRLSRDDETGSLITRNATGAVMRFGLQEANDDQSR